MKLNYPPEVNIRDLQTYFGLHHIKCTPSGDNTLEVEPGDATGESKFKTAVEHLLTQDVRITREKVP